MDALQSRSSNRIGLALSGGTLKAAAHIGVIEQLDQLGIRPHVVAGTSAGSLIATLYAHGYRPQMMRRIAAKFSLWRLFDYGFPLVSSMANLVRYRLGWLTNQPGTTSAQGLLAGHKLESFIERLVRNRTAHIPYYLIATDLKTGNPVTYSNDPDGIQLGIAKPCPHVARAVTASCSLPGVFSPVQMDDAVLVDGALRHYVPVEVLKQAGCDTIIAVNLYRLDENWYPETLVHVLARSFEILLQDSIDHDVDGEHIIVLEPDVQNMTWFAVNQLSNCIEAGKREVDRRVDELIRLVPRTK